MDLKYPFKPKPKKKWYRHFLLSDDPKIARRQKRNTMIFIGFKLAMPFIMQAIVRQQLKQYEQKGIHPRP